MQHVLVVIGTRPEAIKMAPVVQAMHQDPGFAVKLCVTSQHRELLVPMLDFFGLKPDHDLQIMTPGQTLSDITIKVLDGVGAILDNEPFDVVLAQGDTTSAFAAGLAAFYRQVKIGHVEAGLRSGNLAQPFPEEANRRLLDSIADYLFAPTAGAKQNLLGEGRSPERIFVTGNTAIDALYQATETSGGSPTDLPIELNPGEQLILLTAHRRESLQAGLDRVFSAVRRLVDEDPLLRVLFPVHPNPAVRRAAQRRLSGCRRVALVEPLGYPDFVRALQAADLVLTDSGGVQEEAPALGKRVLVLRETTERLEGIDAGVAQLVGTDTELIVRRARELLSSDRAVSDPVVSPFGDGKAAQRIVEVLRSGRLTKPFTPRVATAPAWAGAGVAGGAG